MKKYLIVIAALCLVGMESEYAVQPRSLNIEIDRLGQFTAKQNFAATRWEKGSVVPSFKDGIVDPTTQKAVLKWPIVAYYPNAWYPSIVWFYDNGDGGGSRFRASNGYKWGTPERWAYVHWWTEVWNEQMQRMEIPDVVLNPTAPAPEKPGVHMDDIQGQWMVDDLKRSFTVNKINWFLEHSVYDEPDTGAPLE